MGYRAPEVNTIATKDELIVPVIIFPRGVTTVKRDSISLKKLDYG